MSFFVKNHWVIAAGILAAIHVKKILEEEGLEGLPSTSVLAAPRRIKF